MGRFSQAKPVGAKSWRKKSVHRGLPMGSSLFGCHKSHKSVTWLMLLQFFNRKDDVFTKIVWRPFVTQPSFLLTITSFGFCLKIVQIPPKTVPHHKIGIHWVKYHPFLDQPIPYCCIPPLYLTISLFELQPKFRLMESSIRDIHIFWKLSWGLENDNTLF